jgi:hypothetical protein
VKDFATAESSDQACLLLVNEKSRVSKEVLAQKQHNNH